MASLSTRRPTRSRLGAFLVTLAVVVLVASAAGCARPQPAVPFPSPPPPVVELPLGLDTTVDRVIDGDTLIVAGGHHIRLIGVDTPLI
ncbi:MAG: hypothetical protein QOH36_1862 [Actinomycetota bacterium]|nr:hypothetical protein [Actinomycetota bacterium]